MHSPVRTYLVHVRMDAAPACEPGPSSSLSPSTGSQNVSFYIGQRFQLFDDLHSHIKRYEAQHFVQFWCRDSRTVQAAQKRVSRPLSDKIKYYQLTYGCIHGGKKFNKARGEGKRHIVSTVSL